MWDTKLHCTGGARWQTWAFVLGGYMVIRSGILYDVDWKAAF